MLIQNLPYNLSAKSRIKGANLSHSRECLYQRELDCNRGLWLSAAIAVVLLCLAP